MILLISRTLAATGVATTGLLLAACGSSSVGGTPADTTQPPAAEASGGATTSGGTGTSSPAASSPLHACALVSEQDATTALGTDSGTGHEETHASTYGANGTFNYTIASGGVQVRASSIAGQALCDGNRQPNSVDVPGVGDRAFETPATSAQEATVYFLKGDTCVSITIETTASTGTAKDRVIALATTAAGRL